MNDIIIKFTVFIVGGHAKVVGLQVEGGHLYQSERSFELNWAIREKHWAILKFVCIFCHVPYLCHIRFGHLRFPSYFVDLRRVASIFSTETKRCK